MPNAARYRIPPATAQAFEASPRPRQSQMLDFSTIGTPSGPTIVRHSHNLSGFVITSKARDLPFDSTTNRRAPVHRTVCIGA